MQTSNQNPDDTINPDGIDTEDQQSQQAVNSNGLELNLDEITDSPAPNIEGLEAAAKASEPAFTLDLDRDKPKKPAAKP